LICRLALVTPKAIHAAGFHPTAVLGALAATGGVAAALGLDPPRRPRPSALLAAGLQVPGPSACMRGGPLRPESVRPCWRAPVSPGRAPCSKALTAFFRAFAPSIRHDFARLLEGLGTNWLMPSIAFKSYACGTMTQPYIDCVIALAESGISVDQIMEIVCKVGEGTVHRLWEPLSAKHSPPTAYAAKFSTPYCTAVGFFDRRAGLQTVHRGANSRSSRPRPRTQDPLRDRSPKSLSGPRSRPSSCRVARWQRARNQPGLPAWRRASAAVRSRPRTKVPR
jgi:hypothetical protein